jgi:hypothetical protein
MGRNNQRANRGDFIVEFWKPFITSRPQPGEDCLGYNRSQLRITEEGQQEWLLTDGKSRMLVLENRQDADLALMVARRHSFQCSIERDNKRPDRKDYIVQYWR